MLGISPTTYSFCKQPQILGIEISSEKYYDGGSQAEGLPGCHVCRNEWFQLDEKRMVVNLSNIQLLLDETSVLVKRKKFTVTPTLVPVEDIILNIEAGIHVHRLPICG